MTLRLRNTLGRTVERVEPLEPGRVRMYTCGPTVYRYAHVGNLRSYLLADLIRRVLLYHGLEVTHVKNVTDVGHLRDERFDRGEDRMLVAAGLEHRSTREIADTYEAAFHADEAAVNILPAHVYPRATDHIAEMVEVVEALVEDGHAYVTPEHNVYYAVTTFPGYGRLSGNSLDALQAGHRGAVDHDKRDPADFALWKAASEGRELRWPSPWGEGSPGWHVECTAMARRYLGDRFDIHTGGIDNVFPHHEDEIAQASPLVGDVPARVWVHGEHLLADGHKMAKSAGNFERVTELFERGIDPLAFRYLALTVRYGHKLNYSERSLGSAARALDSLRAKLRALGPPRASGPWAPHPPLEAGAAGDRPEGEATGPIGHQSADDTAGAAGADASQPTYPPRQRGSLDRAHAPSAPLSLDGRSFHRRFVEAIDDDLDLPSALAVVREVVRSDLPADERRWLVLDADAILGLDLHRVWDRPVRQAPAAATAAADVDVDALVAEREIARAGRDYARADALREQLRELGVEVHDQPRETVT